MSNQQWEKPDLPQLKPGSPGENWYNFAASLFCRPFQSMAAEGCPKVHACAAVFAVKTWAQTGTNSTGFNEMHNLHNDGLRWRKGKARRSELTREKVPKLWFLRICLCCRDRSSNGPKNMHSVEEQFGHLLAWHLQLQQSHPCELARLGWLPRQARLPLQSGWYRTGTLCHWPWNVKSTIRKSRASPTQTWIALEKLVQPRGLTFLQCTMTSSIEGPFWTMVAGGCRTVMILVRSYLL